MIKNKKKKYKGNQNDSNPPLYIYNEFVHDNNGVTISKWMWHVNKHTKNKKTQKQLKDKQNANINLNTT